MKKLLTLILLLPFLFSKAQVVPADSTLIPIVEKQGTAMAKLLLAKDYSAFVKYTYPPILKMAGGEAKMTALIKQSFKQIEDQGYKILKVSIENPTGIIHFGKKLQCSVTQLLEMKVPNGRIVSKSTLIGNSDNNGKNWTFLDTHGATLQELQKTIPGLSNDLIIPEKTEPVLYKE